MARRTTPARRPGPPPSALRRAVLVALVRLDATRVRGAAPAVGDLARLEDALRQALAQHLQRAGGPGPGVPAVRIACAHLLVGDVENAHSALLTARDLVR